ncbi:MAG: hypothetical protein WBD37_08600 [Anderseniella sp.]
MSEETTSGSGIAKLVGALGWLCVAGGIGLVGYGLYALFISDFGLAAGGPLMAGGAVTIALGLLSIINATMTRAMVDTANNTARLLAHGNSAMTTSNEAIATKTTLDDIPSFDTEKANPVNLPGMDLDEVERVSTNVTSNNDSDFDQDIPDFQPQIQTPEAIVPDVSDPRGWPLAIDEFDLDGHLAMTLEDGSIGVETPVGWRRLRNLEDARTWLSQQN